MTIFILFGTISKLHNKWGFYKININGKKMYILCKQLKIVLILNILSLHGQNNKFFLAWMTILVFHAKL